MSLFAPLTWLADGVVYRALALAPETRLAEAVHFFVEDTAKIFFLLIVMVYVIGLGRSYVSPEKTRDWLRGRSRWTAYGLAVVLGAVTPFCSCSSVPLFIGFLAAGIPFGVVMAFLITSPLVNEVALVLMGAALGWPFMLAYAGTGMFLGVLGGFLTDRFGLERWVEPFVREIRPIAGATSARTLTWRERRRFARAEVEAILRRVWLYVLIGVGVGAGLHGYVPQEWFLAHAGADNLLAVPLAVLVGIPLYANATGIIPVADVLMQKGVPVGTILAFIMSTVAISLPELIILRQVLKVPMLLFFAGFLLVSLCATGYLFNALF